MSSTSTAIRVEVEGPSSVRYFSSVRKAARALSGNGSDSTERTRSRIRRRLAQGGGRVGRSWVYEA